MLVTGSLPSLSFHHHRYQCHYHHYHYLNSLFIWLFVRSSAKCLTRIVKPHHDLLFPKVLVLPCFTDEKTEAHL